MVFVLAIRQLKGLLKTKVYRILMENKNYIIRGNCLVGAILMATYIQKYVDTAVGIKNDEDHHEVSG